MGSWDRKVKVALLSVFSNTTLIIIKVIAGVLSGSVSIISEAIHSGMDLVASLIAFFSVKESAKPADRDHPYGHGKIENISGIAEGLLIFVAAALIIREAIGKILAPTEIEQTTIAVAVMLVASFVNFLVSRKLYNVAQEEDSMALEADALHLKTDVYTSLGVAIGLVLIKLTGLPVLDPIIAIMVALLIIKEAWCLCSDALNYLVDTKLTDEEEAQIIEVIEQHCNSYKDFHKLKTRKSGNLIHVDFHITVNRDMTAAEIHEIVGCIKKAMREKFGNTRVSVHADPFDDNGTKNQESSLSEKNATQA